MRVLKSLQGFSGSRLGVGSGFGRLGGDLGSRSLDWFRA